MSVNWIRMNLNQVKLKQLPDLYSYNTRLYISHSPCLSSKSKQDLQREFRPNVGQKKLHIDGFVQERCNSIANALELRLSCTNPSLCWCPYSGRESFHGVSMMTGGPPDPAVDMCKHWTSALSWEATRRSQSGVVTRSGDDVIYWGGVWSVWHCCITCHGNIPSCL